MWLEALTDLHQGILDGVHESIDIIINRRHRKVSLRISFGGMELGSEEESSIDECLPFEDIFHQGIDELSFDFEVPTDTIGSGKNSKVYELTLSPDNETGIIAAGNEISWFHFKIKEWYLTSRKEE